MDKDFEWLVVLASHPLRHGFEGGSPSGSCSGALVEFDSHRVLLTVAHSVRPNEVWAMELHHEGAMGMKLWKFGGPQYLSVMDKGRVEDVDLAFAPIPRDLHARWQVHSENGKVVADEPRVVLASPLTDAPVHGARYGFAGHTQLTREPRPPGLDHAILGATTQVETNLSYHDTVEGFDRYLLNHPHPGHEFYEGCSGAPILGEDGTLVGLVVCGSVPEAMIYGLPLRDYRVAILAGLRVGGLDERAQ